MAASLAGRLFSGWAGGGAAWINPGSRNEAGETLLLAFMPLHPVPGSKRPETAVSHRNFQFNLTKPQYRMGYVVGNN